MEKIEIAKKVTGLLTGVGVGTIIGLAIKSNITTTGMSPIMKACVWLGSFALGGLAGKAAINYMNETIDETVEVVNKIKEIKNEQTA